MASRHGRTAALTVVVALLACAPALGRSAARVQPWASYRPGMVLVGFRPGISVAERRALERGVAGRWERPLGFVGSATPAARALSRRTGASFVIGVPRGTVTRAVRELQGQRRLVRYAEPNFAIGGTQRGTTGESRAAVGTDGTRALGSSRRTRARRRSARLPSDPSFGLEWASRDTGQTIRGTTGSVTGTKGADDSAAQVWRMTTGSRSIVIGEPDTGVDYTHPDLAANIWSNPGGLFGCPAGTHGIDVVDPGTPCAPMDTDPPPPVSYGGHGTHLAGIMGAVGNNGIGVAGMNWRTAILPVKWLSSETQGGYVSNLVNALGALDQAKQAGVNVRVANDSTVYDGTYYDSLALETAINALGANGILFVTAAGGAVTAAGDGRGSVGQNDDAVPHYPCSFHLPNEICVTASDEHDRIPSYANYGAHTVDLAAPGDNIYSTLNGDRYGYISGTSSAAAQVSGAAALILSAHRFATPEALKGDIMYNVDKLRSMAGKVATGGQLDVCAAIPGCSVPASINPPTIAGSAQPGRILTCSAGAWRGLPTAFRYRWSRGGTAIRGARSARYRVGVLDESARLRCTVTARNAAGSRSRQASGRGSLVAAPRTLACPKAGGRLGGRRLGRLALGMTRAGARRGLPRFANGRRLVDSFCLYGGAGVQAGYASGKLVRELSRRERHTLSGRIVVAMTSNLHYVVHHTRPGYTLKTARLHLKLGPARHVGANFWYVAPAGNTSIVVEIRAGIVQQIGIANRDLTRTPATQLALLRTLDPTLPTRAKQVRVVFPRKPPR